MELNFDKEIDALLRQTAKSDAAFANGNPQTAHLDADEISAFAENALPEKAKQRLTAHFADCDSCRKNLSELVLLNAENEVETIQEEKVAVIAPAIPWYRKLFVFPNLAYTMGALVLAFTGLTAFIVLQNFSGLNSEVAQSSNTASRDTGSAPIQSKPMSANANSAASDTAAANTNSAANLSPQSSPEVSSNTALSSKSEDEANTPTDLKQTNQPRSETDSDPATPRENTPKTNEGGKNQPENRPVARPQKSADAPTLTESQTPPKPAPVTDTEERKAAAKRNKIEILTGRSGGEKVKEDVQNNDAAQGSLSSGRQISGKTFNRRDDVWYDSAYRNQPTTNVRRGTNEYRNLDSGLRSIAEKFRETVVVVWKEKAYRIQ